AQRAYIPSVPVGRAPLRPASPRAGTAPPPGAGTSRTCRSAGSADYAVSPAASSMHEGVDCGTRTITSTLLRLYLYARGERRKVRGIAKTVPARSAFVGAIRATQKPTII